MVDSSTGKHIASSPEYYMTGTTSEHFGYNHDLVQNAIAGYSYVVEVVVGAGGGHVLNIKDFSFVTNFSYSASRR